MKKLLMITAVMASVSVPVIGLANVVMVGGGDLIFTPTNALPVVFSHDKHVHEKGLTCTSCHYEIFQMAHGSCNIDMNSLAKGGFCGHCHNGGNAFDVKDKKNCTRCHRQLP